MKLFRQKVRPRPKDLQDKISSIKRGLFRKLLPGFLIAGVLVLILIIILAFKSFLFKSDYFKIAKVEGEIEEISSWGIYGQNIFKINLKALKFKLERLHPEFKEINIIRVLPNQLKISVKVRKIVAQISAGRYYPIDIEGIILPQITNFPDENLPIITGLERDLLNKFTLNLSNEKKVAKALELIKEIEENKNISNYKLKKIDVSDLRNLSIYLGGSRMLEIKIGDSDFKERLKNLQAILAEIGTEVREAKYIDLRFNDPIISPK